MNYQDFLDYIYKRHSGNVKLELDRMLNVLQAMDYPNKKLQGIHIAGTNGKGSTAAICESLCLSHGLSTGMNTSPHLIDYRERFRLNGNNITLEKLITKYKEWEKILEENEASFFEITTALAFHIFDEEKVDTAIFEVGLGGRLDGTNPFKSTVSVITSIALDHTKSLGDSIEKIAFEKAGILKENTPLILGKIPTNADHVISKIAVEKNVPVLRAGTDFAVNNICINTAGTKFDYKFGETEWKNLNLNLLGHHQAYNAAVALTAFIIFMQKIGKTVNEENIRLALKKINWPGRMQIIRQHPTVIIDGAHNEEGIKTLKHNLQNIFPNQKIFFVLAILRDKNLQSIIKDICAVSYKVYISKNHSQRAAEIEEQEEIVKKYQDNYEVIHDVVDAARTAIKEAKSENIVIISGSLYTISEVLKAKNL